MSVTIRRHAGASRFPDLPGWLDLPWPALVPFGPGQPFRVEDYAEDGKYVVRAELPGVDPEHDVQVTVSSGMLTIHAERREEKKEEQHSEFRYGSLTRSVMLPEGADQEQITAAYDKGVLEVTVPVPEQAETATRTIPVARPG